VVLISANLRRTCAY